MEDFFRSQSQKRSLMEMDDEAGTSQEKRLKTAGGSMAPPAASGVGAQMPIPQLIQCPKDITHLRMFRRGIMWFYHKSRSDTAVSKPEFGPWIPWMSTKFREGTTTNSTFPKHPAESILESSIIVRNIQLGFPQGFTGDEGGNWAFFNKYGYCGGYDRWAGSGSSSMAAQFSHLYQEWKMSNCKLTLLPMGETGKIQENGGRQVPKAWVDYEFKNEKRYSKAFDYGIVSSTIPRNSHPHANNLEAHVSSKRIMMSDSTVTIRAINVGGDTTTTDTHNTAAIDASKCETPWLSTTDMTDPFTLTMITQMGIYKNTVGKNLMAVSYSATDTGYAENDDNYISIPYTISCDINFRHILV